ncbi:WD repeat-containing protein 75 [Holothuria leucospilota]|uniref:WD repeat-containing protein 75 n=1 Tax=Holothuria leucospilota TaxID=206669 RepID=A0A9Q0YNG0_HOLLE|nr:WD repeat-containing protein 75 [Holothuria leucospilota]
MAAHLENMRATLIQSGGSCIVRRRSIFADDSRYLLVCVGNHVKVYSTATGKCVQNLIGHQQDVTGVTTNTQNKLQAVTCSLDGTVRYWDLIDGTMLKVYSYPWPIHNMLLHQKFPGTRFFLCRDEIRMDKGNCLALVEVNRVEDKSELDEEFIFHELTSESDKNVAVAGNGEYLAGISGNKVLVYFFEGSKPYFSFGAGKEPLSCLACHPTEYTIAAGNEMGHVMIIYNFHQQRNDLICNLEHWHAHRVEDICFSPNGVFLYSVGHECVLVEWNLQDGKKDFLPRLGAPINFISCSGNVEKRAVSLLDNAILILTGNKIQHTIQGISRSTLYFPTSYLPCGLQVDPRTHALVKNGRIGHLQFYQVEEDELIFNMDVTGENYVSGATLGNILKYTTVVQAGFDDKGDWLATVEEQNVDENSEFQCRLKFWIFDEKKQSFLLNTTVESPHYKEIFAVKFQPKVVNKSALSPMAVTVSLDGNFKLWTYADSPISYKKSKCWNCRCVGFYKNMIPSGVTFSSDGSLLGVSFNNTITLWEPEMNVLRKTLCHTLSNQPIRTIKAGRGQTSHLLVCATADRITVWNLLSCQVSWSVKISCKLLTSDPGSELLVAIDTSKSLFVFNPSKPKPVFSMRGLKGNVHCAVFVPRSSKLSLDLKKECLLPWQPRSQLYLLMEDEDLMAVVSDEEASLQSKKQTFKTNLEENLPLTPFAEFIQSQGAASGVKKRKSDLLKKHIGESSFVNEIMQTPPHILPAVKTISSQFLHSLLLSSEHSREAAKNESDSEDEEDEKRDDEDSESEAEVTMTSPHEETVRTSKTNQEKQWSEQELSQLTAKSKAELSSLRQTFEMLGRDL